MKEKILQILRETPGFVSGQELCRRMEVSRTAIWKAMNQLKAAGYEIEAVKNRGYRLVSIPDVMFEQEISSQLNTQWFGRKILYFDSVDSTNNEIKRQAEKEVCHGLLAVAEKQTAGRGRRGKSWISPKGTGIWMSFMLTPKVAPEKAQMLTLVAALAVEKAVEDVTGLNAQIKWPNDIVVNGHKICGMLTELSTEMAQINYVVIGIGINANTEEIPEDIKDIATSLYREKGSKVSRAAVIAAIGRYFEEYYARFMEKEDLRLLVKEYNQKLVNAGKQVRLVDGDKEEIFEAVGIDEMGLLEVKDGNGEIKKIRSGEVSVRGLYGYV